MSGHCSCGNPRDRNGRYCKRCHREYMREWRKTHPLIGDALRRARARCHANVALRRGQITRQPCARCGGPGEEMHHDDYAKPLEVTWLCKPCHRDVTNAELYESVNRETVAA